MSHLTLTETANVIVKIVSDDGIIGWGEAVEAMDVTGENQGRILAAVEALGPTIIGETPSPGRIWHRFTKSVYGNRTAIGAIDMALYDLVGKAHGVPVAELLGGRVRDGIPALTLVGSGDTTADMKTFGERYDAGYRWFKLKLGIGEPLDEAETLRQMTAATDDTVVCGDTNGGWTEAVSARFLHEISDLPIAYIEQPTERIDALLRLAAATPVAICADESARSIDDLVSFVNSPLAGVSLKLIKHGGITGVMRAATVCEHGGLAINLAGKVAETSISAAANIHCGAAMADTSFGCSPSNWANAADVTHTPLLHVDGALPVPTGPGLGVDVDEVLLGALAV